MMILAFMFYVWVGAWVIHRLRLIHGFWFSALSIAIWPAVLLGHCMETEDDDE